MNAPKRPKRVNHSLALGAARFAKPGKVFRGVSGDLERRAKPRLQEHFPALLCGVDSGDLTFSVDCVIDNISSTGLYLRMPRQMPTGGERRVIVHLLGGPITGTIGGMYGEIMRDEVQPDGRHGIAVAIKRHKVL